MRIPEGRADRGPSGAGPADDLTSFDWIGTAAFVARNAPGFGDPLAMPIDLFASVATSVSDMIVRENGGDSGRSAVDREMRRLLG